MDKKALYKMIVYIYQELSDDEGLDSENMREAEDIYNIVIDFITSAFGLDYDDADFVYASYVESMAGCNDDINLLTIDKIILPKLTNFKGIKSYSATVSVEDEFNMETYLPVMMRYAIQEYNIDFTSSDITDWHDTWDHEIDISED